VVAAVSIALSLACTPNVLASTTIKSFTASPSMTQAGGHSDWNVAFSLDGSPSAEIAKDVTYDAPPGVGLLPAAVTHCLAAELALNECPPSSQVGLTTVRSRYEGEAEFLLGTAPVFALVAPAGQFGALGFTIPTLDTEAVAGLSLRGASDYGQRLRLANLPHGAPITRIDLTLWGVPADVGHNAERFPRGSPGNPPGCPGLEDASCITGPTSSSAPLSPFTLNPTSCRSQLSATLEVQTYESPETSSQAEASYPETTGCNQLSFNPSLYVEPTTTVAYSRSGLKLNLTAPQEMSPTIPTPSGFRNVLVTLPKGMDINPELPEELIACGNAEAALGSEEPASCPEEALLGTSRVELASLTSPMPGEIYLGFSESEEEARLLLIAQGGGVDLKLPIGLSEDPESGQLQLALEQPQIPITAYALDLFGGRNAILRTPPFCGTYPTTAAFTPWDELGTQVAEQFFEISSGPGGGPCLGEATAIRVKLSPETVPADGKSQTAATIEIKDAEGAGLPEQEVMLTSSDPAERLGEVIDNENGTYSTTITASGTPGTATITATDLSTKPKLSGSASLTQGATSAQPPPPPTPPTQPQVSFSVKPPPKDRSRRPRFVFAADVAEASFSCKLDRGPYRPCSSPLRLPKLAIGAHSFAVRATTAAGTGSPAVWHFRVLGHKRQHRRRHPRRVLHAR
jgi:hypothetical protein